MKILKELDMLKSAAGCLIIAFLILSACSPLTPNRPGEPIEPTQTLSVPSETPFPIPDTPPNTVTPAPTETSIETEESKVDGSVKSSQPEGVQVITTTTTTRYFLQIGSPVAMANFIAPEAGCNWLGVGGQAFDIHGNPVTNLVVEVGGTLEGREVFHLALTGNSPNLGIGGFAINLANHAVASSGTLWILLYDLTGEPLTSKIGFSTYADCTKNFILVNFVERNADFVDRVKLPLILK